MSSPGATSENNSGCDCPHHAHKKPPSSSRPPARAPHPHPHPHHHHHHHSHSHSRNHSHSPHPHLSQSHNHAPNGHPPALGNPNKYYTYLFGDVHPPPNAGGSSSNHKAVGSTQPDDSSSIVTKTLFEQLNDLLRKLVQLLTYLDVLVLATVADMYNDSMNFITSNGYAAPGDNESGDNDSKSKSLLKMTGEEHQHRQEAMKQILYEIERAKEYLREQEAQILQLRSRMIHQSMEWENLGISRYIEKEIQGLHAVFDKMTQDITNLKRIA